MKVKKKILLFGLFILIVTGLGVSGIILLKPNSPIPKDISSQLKFSPFLASGDAKVLGAVSDVSYSASSEVLAYNLNYDGVKMVVSQQPTPESFTDVPQVYDELLKKLNSQESFEVSIGKVSITLPTELKGGQTAVMNSKGVLMFVKPDKNLTRDQWRDFFSKLKLQN